MQQYEDLLVSHRNFATQYAEFETHLRHNLANETNPTKLTNLTILDENLKRYHTQYKLDLHIKNFDQDYRTLFGFVERSQ